MKMIKISQILAKILKKEHIDLANHAIETCMNSTNSRVLHAYSSFKNPKVISALIENIHTSSKTLEHLAFRQDMDYRDLLQILKHPNITNPIIEHLKQHNHLEVRNKAILAEQKLNYHNTVEKRFA